MVSFTSITNGVFLISIIMVGSSEAAPASPGHIHYPPHDDLSGPGNFTLPSLIPGRTRKAPHHLDNVDLNAETRNMEEDIQWLAEQGIDFANMTQRGDVQTIYGMTLDIPADTRPFGGKDSLNRLDTSIGDAIILATDAQVSTFELYAGIASTAYCRRVTGLGEWNCENCLKYVPDGEMIYTFSSLITDNTGFVLRSDNQRAIHVVFRGTNSIRNSIADVIVAKSDYPPVEGAQVHTGFYDAYLESANSYFPYVQEQLNSYPDYKVVVSGHSLGGALALLSGMDLYQREVRLTPENLSIYTVGCPRVGDTAFAYYVDSTGIPFYRSVHNRDIFAHYPPQAMGYLHPGIEVWDVPGQTVHICPSNIESEYCSNSITPFTSFFDHLTYYGINEGLCL